MQFGNFADEIITSYLNNRKQFVLINGNESNKIGVPQGSILGELMCVIYVNDIPNALNCIPRYNTDDVCLVVHECKANNFRK